MAASQERMKLKKMSCDVWSTREQLCLASSVLKSGDQNWISVSRSLKPFAEKEALRPQDWFSQKSCALQYSQLLENADTPKRKKRESGETTGESIVRRLTQERILELGQILAFQRDEYQKLKSEVSLLKSGTLSEEKLQKMCQAIEQEEKEQEQKNKAHATWLAKRQKLEPQSPQHLSIGPPKKSDNLSEIQESVESTEDDEKKNKGGRSPLLTSLLKSPSPTTQIQSQSQIAGSPTIASLLGSSPKVPNPTTAQNVTPQLHQLIATPDASTVPEKSLSGASTLSMLLECPTSVDRGSLHLQKQCAPTIPIVENQKISNSIHVPTLSNQISQESNALNVQVSAIAAIHNIPATEAQIINQITNVISNDIVMDKDEFNERIVDIEEYIKEDITSSPHTKEILKISEEYESTNISLPHIVVSDRSDLRNIDEPISPSNSPTSEIAIEDIDSSTSNIAEIIGTIGLMPMEIKPTILSEPEKEKSKDKDEKLESQIEESKGSPECQKLESETDKSTGTVETKCKDVAETVNTNEQVISDSVLPTGEKESEKCKVPETKTDVVEENETNVGKRDDSSEDIDQLELSLAQITGTEHEESDKCSKTEPEKLYKGNEKIQDISEILGEDNTENQKRIEEVIGESKESLKTVAVAYTILDKVVEMKQADHELEKKPSNASLQGESKELQVNNATNFEKKSMKSTKEEKEKPSVMELEESDKEKKELISSIIEIDIQEERNIELSKSDETKKESDKKLINNFITSLESKKEEKETNEKESKELKVELKKDTEPESISKKESAECAESTGEDMVEVDEEEPTMSKLSGGRAMKTYSKKPIMVVDSEAEGETSGEGADYRAWKKAVMLVYNRLATHKYASVFLRPITEDHAPGYHSVVFRPMDLSTIKKNIDNGTIRSTRQFQRDVMLMFQNAIMYNQQGSYVYNVALSMQKECLQHMQILVQATGEVSFRRETRTAASCSSEGSDSVRRKRSHITPSPHDSESPRMKKHKKSEND